MPALLLSVNWSLCGRLSTRKTWPFIRKLFSSAFLFRRSPTDAGCAVQEELPWLQLGRSLWFQWVHGCWAELLWLSCRKAANPSMAPAGLRQTDGLGKPKSFREAKTQMKLLLGIILCSNDREELSAGDVCEYLQI